METIDLETHKNLIRWLNTPIGELKRKAEKAVRCKQKLWTQEEVDFAEALASLRHDEFERYLDGDD